MKYTIETTKLAHVTNEYNLMFLYSFNPIFSLKMRKHIIDEIDSLSTFPHSHTIYKHSKRKTYRKLVVNDLYHIIYFVSKNTVRILYIIDARKEFDEYYYYLN